MAVPAKRTTSSKRDMRRSHHGISAVQSGDCPKCGHQVLGHRMCANCGFYKGKEVVNVLIKMDKKEKKKKEKKEAKQEERGKKDAEDKENKDQVEAK